MTEEEFEALKVEARERARERRANVAFLLRTQIKRPSKARLAESKTVNDALFGGKDD